MQWKIKVENGFLSSVIKLFLFSRKRNKMLEYLNDMQAHCIFSEIQLDHGKLVSSQFYPNIRWQ